LVLFATGVNLLDGGDEGGRASVQVLCAHLLPAALAQARHAGSPAAYMLKRYSRILVAQPQYE